MTDADGTAVRVAAAYRASREVPREGLAAWRAVVAEEAAPGPGRVLLDVGAGTGAFASAFHDWFGARVLAVEPDGAMRALIPAVPGGVVPLGGRAERLPLADASADAAWLGSVVHHIGDLAAAARELRRVLRPGAPVLIRNTFPGRCADDLRVRFFPETARSVDGYPSVDEVCTAFGAAGFRRTGLHSLPQRSAPTLAAYAAGLNREADSELRALTDPEYTAGLTRLHAAAAEAPHASAVSWMDLLVLR
ncbi:class I SAM-dependent methyltransferase [Streptomyces termitum]|uniref:Methyltransferase type 11 domain-containing protein n=1 Tax=Streptomyces termitum TaxID=67368 RepID=A0A918T9N2_9ACTN|nr:class I SAM-dependent methyltransferase [Streptomyces termitum]GHB09634.1 hypothetical protein GCM10010305_60610 [Streptomyces termitum]